MHGWHIFLHKTMSEELVIYAIEDVVLLNQMNVIRQVNYVIFKRLNKTPHTYFT